MDSGKRLRPEQRLRAQTSFKKLVRRGNFARGVSFYVWVGRQKDIVREGVAQRPMLGIVVSRQVAAKATERNGLKRRVREIFRTNQEHFKKEIVCLIKMRPFKIKPETRNMEAELLALLKQAGAWK